MNAKDLIKEIDPDYTNCMFCHRLVHEKDLKPNPDAFNILICVDRYSCKKVISYTAIRRSLKKICHNPISTILKNRVLFKIIWVEIKFLILTEKIHRRDNESQRTN